MQKKVVTLSSVGILMLTAILAVWIMNRYGIYPIGENGWLYIHGCLNDHLYDITSGNGSINLCSGSPFVYLSLGVCIKIAGTSFTGYSLWLGMMLLIAGGGFIYIGHRADRQILCLILGLAWIVMPFNIYVLGITGMLPLFVISLICPVFIFEVYDYCISGRFQSLIVQFVFMFVMILSNIEAGVIAAMTAFAFMLFWQIFCRDEKKSPFWKSAVAILAAFLLNIYWIITYLGSDSMKIPVIPENQFRFYVGIGFCVLSVLGVFLSHKKSVMGFLLSAIALIALVFSKNNYIVMAVSVAAGLSVIAFVQWKTLKKPMVCAMTIVLLVDCIPNLVQLNHKRHMAFGQERMEYLSDTTLLAKAKDITKQRMILLDNEGLGSAAEYYIADTGKKVSCSNVVRGQRSPASENVALVQEALTEGKYLYMFNGCLELGDDTVLVRISRLKEGKSDVDQVCEAAKKLGYILSEKSEDYLLFHLENCKDGSFGVVTKYDVIGIGTVTRELAMVYPDMELGISKYVDDYSYEELAEYKTVYLNGFSYHSKKKAESLLKKLADKSIRVVISADNTNFGKSDKFLGASFNTIYFENGYPILHVAGEDIYTELFDGENTSMSGTYINGLDKESGYIVENGKNVVFLGSVYNDNIIFIGINLLKHFALTKDSTIVNIISDIMQVSPEDAGEKEIVPLDVEYTDDGISIYSEYDDVNTGIVYIDGYMTEENITVKNNLIYVNKGKTDIIF